MKAAGRADAASAAEQRATPPRSLFAFFDDDYRGPRGRAFTPSSAPSRHSTHRNMAVMIGAPVRLVVRAATHVNPKATKGHTKTRPKKVRRADRPPKP